MTAERTPRDRHFDGRMIAHLRGLRAQRPDRDLYSLTPDELDALLDAAAERDALAAAACAMPDEKIEPSLRLVCKRCGGKIEPDPHNRSTRRAYRHVGDDDRAGAERAMTKAGIHAAEPVDITEPWHHDYDEPFAPPLSTLRASCTRCLDEITTTTDELGRPDVLWAHVDPERMRANHFATPTPGFSVVEDEPEAPRSNAFDA